MTTIWEQHMAGLASEAGLTFTRTAPGQYRSAPITQESTMEHPNPDAPQAPTFAPLVTAEPAPPAPEADEQIEPGDQVNASLERILDAAKPLAAPPPTVREIVDGMIDARPAAIHLGSREWLELQADNAAVPHIGITSDGVTYRGIPVAVEGGVELPAPRIPDHAVDETWMPNIGSRVRYHPIIGEASDGRTYTVRAIEPGNGNGTRARIWLEGKSGFVAIEALSPCPNARQAGEDVGAWIAPDQGQDSSTGDDTRLERESPPATTGPHNPPRPAGHKPYA